MYECNPEKRVSPRCENLGVFFTAKTIPASMGGSAAGEPNAPYVGAYANKIVQYEADGSTFIYDSNGNYLPIADTILSVNGQTGKVELKISDLANDLGYQTADEVMATLNNALYDYYQKEEVDAQHKAIETTISLVDARVDATNKKVGEIEDKLRSTVIANTKLTADESTVTTTKTSKTLATGETATTTEAYPVASETQAGVMNAATYKALYDDIETTNAILNGSVMAEDLPKEPSQDELTQAWKEGTGKDEVINRASIWDVANKQRWEYFTNTKEWVVTGTVTTEIEVNQFTNSAAGIIKGSEADGQVYAEADGTGSVNGWDKAKSDIENNARELDSLESRVDTMEDTLDELDENFVTKEEFDRVVGANVDELNKIIDGEGV